MKKELESKNLLDKNKVEFVKEDPDVAEDDSGIIPISPDIEDYNLIDRNKVEIIETNQQEEQTISAEKAVNDLLQGEKDPDITDQHKNEEIKQDPWLNKDYVGKPLKVK